uniref:hypothetical protein n=1 Tax=Ruminiclostridium cellobioparum TaxID=29355 RepID=UPI0035E43EBB
MPYRRCFRPTAGNPNHSICPLKDLCLLPSQDRDGSLSDHLQFQKPLPPDFPAALKSLSLRE